MHGVVRAGVVEGDHRRGAAGRQSDRQDPEQPVRGGAGEGDDRDPGRHLHADRGEDEGERAVVRQAAGEIADDRAEDHARDHVDRDDPRRVGGGQALAGREERHAPQQHEHRAGERCGEVRPEREPCAGMCPGRPDADARVDSRRHDTHDSGVRVHRDVRTALGGVVAHDEPHEDREEQAETGDAAERDRPGGGVQQGGDRHQRDQLPRLPDDPGELDHDGAALRGEPCGHQPQHGGEHGGVAGSEEDTRDDRDADAGGEGHGELSGRHEQHPRRDDRTGSVAIEEDADRNLHPAVHRELHDGEQCERRGVRLEAVGGLDTDGTQRCAVRDGEHVGRDADGPDRPGPPPRRGDGGVGDLRHPSTLLLRGARARTAVGANFSRNRRPHAGAANRTISSATACGMEMYGEWLADSVRESLAAGSYRSRMRSPVAGASTSPTRAATSSASGPPTRRCRS
ncbi:protein of unknown function [Microbacterium sp. Nx66]|nr:protein of unknown function [Microbacterium sp. Nx66]